MVTLGEKTDLPYMMILLYSNRFIMGSSLSLRRKKEKKRERPKRKESINPCKDLYTNVHRSSICNCQKEGKESKGLSRGKWLRKFWYVQLYNEILFSNKKAWTTETITWMNFKIMLLSKISLTKKRVLTVEFNSHKTLENTN